MNWQLKGTSKEKSSSKNPPDINGENYVFVKYSDLMDLLQSAKNASIALSHLATSSADIKLMSMRPTAWSTVGVESSQKSTDISDTKQNKQSQPRSSEADAFGLNMERISKSTVSPLPDSANGRMRKSRKK
jgi:hypothetical protein